MDINLEQVMDYMAWWCCYYQKQQSLIDQVVNEVAEDSYQDQLFQLDVERTFQVVLV